MSYCSEFFKSVSNEIKEPFSYTACIVKGNVYVDGFLSITSITHEKITFTVRGGKICIIGENLVIKKTEGDSMVVSGKVKGVNYEN